MNLIFQNEIYKSYKSKYKYIIMIGVRISGIRISEVSLYLKLALICFFRTLDCGNHTCEKPCHDDECDPCALSPGMIKTCPCGSNTLETLSTTPRTSCLDPVLTCDSTCGLELSCGPIGEYISIPRTYNQCNSTVRPLFCAFIL